MDKNRYTSLEAITILVHALDYVVKEYTGMLYWQGNPVTGGELLSWYLHPQQFLVDHIMQEFIK